MGRRDRSGACPTFFVFATRPHISNACAPVRARYDLLHSIYTTHCVFRRDISVYRIPTAYSAHPKRKGSPLSRHGTDNWYFQVWNPAPKRRSRQALRIVPPRTRGLLLNSLRTKYKRSNDEVVCKTYDGPYQWIISAKKKKEGENERS